MQGLDVWREGVCLHFGEKLIWIDAPCSGVKMLWFGLFLAAFLVCFFRFSNLKSLAVFASAFLIILVGNIFRASALFYIEAEIFDAPRFMHEAVGVFSFAFVALGIVFVAQFWRTLQCDALRREVFAPQGVTLNANRFAQRFATIVFLTSCALAFFAPLWFSSEKKARVQSPNFRGFPATFENQPLVELPLTEREKFFLEDFPGSVGRFSDGKREVVIRFVTEATRKLHPASDCFRAIGYETKPLPLKVDDEGKRWSCFSAAKTDERLRVCERIYAGAGGEWTDVSAWYWSSLNESVGEWWAVTTAENE
jgi:exosortase/archaeosortase family protein